MCIRLSYLLQVEEQDGKLVAEEIRSGRQHPIERYTANTPAKVSKKTKDEVHVSYPLSR